MPVSDLYLKTISPFNWPINSSLLLIKWHLYLTVQKCSRATKEISALVVFHPIHTTNNLALYAHVVYVPDGFFFSDFSKKTIFSEINI